MGLSIKSNGVFTRAMAARNLTSIIPPKTMPKIMGTIGKDRRFKINPNTPKAAAIAQSVAELRRE